MFTIFITDASPYSLLQGHHNVGLVAVSIVVAILSSMMGLQIAGMANHARSALLRHIALLSGSLALGGGIWSMHFIGMLAFELGTHAHYNPMVTLLSMFPSVFASWITLHMLSRDNMTPQRLIIGGILVGAGIGAMHYSGMAAMHMSAELRYDLGWFVTSIIVAIVMAMLALWVRFGLRNRARFNSTQITMMAGVIMGLAIAAMHYTGMAAARFIGTPTDSSISDSNHTFLAIIIGATTVAISLLVVAGNLVLRYRQLYLQMQENEIERSAIARELSAREQQYGTLIANMPGVAFRSQATAPWAVIFISDAITQISGWESEKFFSCEINLGDIVHPDDIERVTQEITPALENKSSYTVEYRMIHRDQSERWVSESASGVYDEQGDLIWIDGVIIDITESKLRNAEFEGVVHAISRALAVAEFDMNGFIVDANENFLVLTGYELKDLFGRHHSILCRPEEIASAEYAAFWSELRAGSFNSGEFLRMGCDGKQIWIQAAYNPIFDADGNPWKVVKLAIDITARKAMETDLLIAKDRAEQASSAKGMFLANMSHEIRTPMNAIIGFTELLLDSPLQTDQLKQLQTVSRSARSLLTLLNDILDTAKLERGALELDIEAFSLQEMCHHIVNELHIQAHKKGLALIVDYALGTPDIVRGDALRLRQVIINLMGNAIKFTPTGSVTLHVSHEGNDVNISVIDTGIGIAADRIQHIFTPFTQADATMARRFGGTGLGTTIARQLTELMGGTITATSTLGEGSRFDVSLPLPAAHAVAVTAVINKINLPALHILIADDVPQNREVLELMLRRDGHTVTSVDNGLFVWHQFKQQLKQQRFDLILMDIQMPEVDGLEASKMIRAWEAEQQLSETPIIALTASVLEQDRKNAKLSGMNGFASKPIDRVALNNEMARCLNLSPQSNSPAHTQDNQLLTIDWHSAEQRWGDRTTLKNALHSFCEHHTQLAFLFETNDGSTIQQIAHRLKGAAANLGLNALAQLAGQIEADKKITPQRIAAIEKIMAEIKTEIVAIADITPSATPLVTANVSIHLLHTLKRAYSQGAFDDDAYQTLTQLLPHPYWHHWMRRKNNLILMRQ